MVAGVLIRESDWTAVGRVTVWLLADRTLRRDEWRRNSGCNVRAEEFFARVSWFRHIVVMHDGIFSGLRCDFGVFLELRDGDGH